MNQFDCRKIELIINYGLSIVIIAFNTNILRNFCWSLYEKNITGLTSNFYIFSGVLHEMSSPLRKWYMLLANTVRHYRGLHASALDVSDDKI